MEQINNQSLGTSWFCFTQIRCGPEAYFNSVSLDWYFFNHSVVKNFFLISPPEGVK